MLVLSRKVGERILIGDGLVVTVLAVRGRRIRLGVQVPELVPIRREEVSFFPPDRDPGETVGTAPGAPQVL
jgi:carbon storage regulator CsrA